MSTPKKSPAQRDLGWKHVQTVKALKAAHIDGTPCWWCGQAMYLDRTLNWDYSPSSTDRSSGSLAGDHSTARAHGGTKADRLLHGICNKQRQDGRKDDQRPALTGHKPPPLNNLGILAIGCWP